MANAKALKEAGNNAFRNGRYDEAVTCYSECMKADPSESTYPLNRSMAYLKMQKYAEAERDATKSLNLLPSGNTKALFRRATARKALNKLDEAKADLQAALKEEPANATIKADLEELKVLLAKRVKGGPTAPTPNGTKSAGNSGQTKPSTATSTASPKEDTRQSSLSEQKRSALKAAIAPETQSASSGRSAFLNPVATRRLGSSSVPGSAQIPSASSATPTPPQKPQQEASPPAKKDFKALRAQRDVKHKATVLANPTSVSEAVKGKEAPTTSTTASTGARKTPRPAIPTVPAPKTIYEFERRWSDRTDTANRVSLLQSLYMEKVDLPAFVGQNLSPELVDDIIDCLSKELPLHLELRPTAAYLLEQIPRCARFDFVSMLCAKAEVVRQILDPGDPVSQSILSSWLL